MKLRKVAFPEYQRYLSSSALSPAEVSASYVTRKGIPGDSSRIIKDSQLKQAYIEIMDTFGEMGNSRECLMLSHDSKGDWRTLTKGFVNVSKTYENLDHYLVKEEVRDGRKRQCVLAAVEVLKDLIGRDCRLQPQRLTSHSEIADFISNGNATCGIIKQGKKKHHMRFIKQYSLKLAHEIRKGTVGERQTWIPVVGGHRAQFSNLISPEGKLNPMKDINLKDRYVWSVDAATACVEAQFSMPLTKYLAQVDFFSPGKEPEILRSLVREARESNYYWVGLDFSKFDQTIPAWLIEVCFDIIKGFYDEQFHHELNWIARNFIHTKVLLPGGVVIQKHKGIPSGSGFTQIVGTMCNMLIMLSYFCSKVDGYDREAMKKHIRDILYYDLRRKKVGMFAQGDDNLFFTKSFVDINDVAGFGKAVFGVNINPEKSDFGKTCEHPIYLKREWRHDGEYQRPEYLVVNTTHPEHVRDYKGYSAWHIIYGLYLTYPCSFPVKMSEEWLIGKMAEHGGVDALERIPSDALPGVMKAYPIQSRRRFLTRARKVYSSIAA